MHQKHPFDFTKVQKKSLKGMGDILSHVGDNILGNLSVVTIQGKILSNLEETLWCAQI